MIFGALAVVLLLIIASFILFGLTMKLIWALIIGLIVGVIARFILPGEDDTGILATSLLGIGGSFMATILGKLLKLYSPGQTAGFIGSILGAMILLGIFRMVKK